MKSKEPLGFQAFSSFPSVGRLPEPCVIGDAVGLKSVDPLGFQKLSSLINVSRVPELCIIDETDEQVDKLPVNNHANYHVKSQLLPLDDHIIITTCKHDSCAIQSLLSTRSGSGIDDEGKLCEEITASTSAYDLVRTSIKNQRITDRKVLLVELLHNMKLFKAELFGQLPCPLPRCQEVPSDHFGIPDEGDIIVAISHAWRNQYHPDPQGEKLGYLKKVMDSLVTKGHGKRVFVFLDFLCLTQRPFEVGQKPRTATEEKRFMLAVSCMHLMYFLADCIVHVVSEDYQIEGEEEMYTAERKDLQTAVIDQIGPWVHVVGCPATHIPNSIGRRSLRSAGSIRRVFARTGHVHSKSGSSIGFSALSSGSSLMLSFGSSGRSNSSLGQYLRRKSSTHSASSSCNGNFPRPSDRVCSVENEAVSSLKHYHTLIDGKPPEEKCMVQLCRYPFGKVNRIHADDRGWIFLERFITMVKCAMLDECNAKTVVLTNSDSLAAYIESGARRLRKAVKLDKMSVSSTSSAYAVEGHLEKELNMFLEELSRKQFSASSLDKLNHAKASAIDDCEIVQAIMFEFIQHLESNWEAEVAKQNVRLGRLGAAVHNYFVVWDEFSATYAQRLAAASVTSDPTPILSLFAFTMAAPLLIVLVPNSSPQDAWQQQYIFWSLLNVLNIFGCCSFFVVFFTTVLGESYNTALAFRAFTWLVSTCAILMCPGLGIVSAWNLFPVPFLPALTCAVFTICAPSLVWVVPVARRSEPNFIVESVYAIGITLCIPFVFAIGFPLLNTALPLVGTYWQMVLISSYLIAKLGFERLGGVLARRFGADTMPLFVFMCAYIYEYNLCNILVGGFNLMIFLELVAFDTAENGYFLFSLYSQMRNKRGHDGAERRNQQYIVAVLILREMAEIMVPVQFLGQLVLMRRMQPRFNQVVCTLTDAQFHEAVTVLVIDICVEVFIAIFTYVLLRKAGFTPLRMLRGLAATFWFPFVSSGICSAVYFSALQHSHFGNDLTFQLLWLGDQGARWRCGLSWEA